MTQAIITKYLGPAGARGSRIKATCASGSVTVGYPHELSGQAVHRFAADALCRKLGWDSSNLIGGSTSTGYAFVFVGG